MSALAMAMYLTGAGAVSLDDAQRRRRPPPAPVPVMLAPPPPIPIPYPLPPPRPVQPPGRGSANLNSYFSTDDYPAAALRARAQGMSRIHVVVDMIGRVIACDVDGGSGSAALDAAACRIARARARYAPARNAAGAFVCDVDWGEIVWRLPLPRRRLPRAGPAAAAPPPIETQLTPGTCPGRTP